MLWFCYLFFQLLCISTRMHIYIYIYIYMYVCIYVYTLLYLNLFWEKFILELGFAIDTRKKERNIPPNVDWSTQHLFCSINSLKSYHLIVSISLQIYLLITTIVFLVNKKNKKLKLVPKVNKEKRTQLSFLIHYTVPEWNSSNSDVP